MEGYDLPRREKFAHKMKKYENAYLSGGQHDFETINYFFDQLDLNQDSVICLDDLKAFRKKHKLAVQETDLARLIEAQNYFKKKSLKYQLNPSL